MSGPGPYVVEFVPRAGGKRLEFTAATMDDSLQTIRDVLQLRKDHQHYQQVVVEWDRPEDFTDEDVSGT